MTVVLGRWTRREEKLDRTTLKILYENMASISVANKVRYLLPSFGMFRTERRSLVGQRACTSAHAFGRTVTLRVVRILSEYLFSISGERCFRLGKRALASDENRREVVEDIFPKFG